MSKNVSINEGGKARKFGATKRLAFEKLEGGLCYWVPEDERKLTTKYAFENGVFLPKDDSAFAYSQVTANIIDTIIDLDDMEWDITIDEIDIPHITVDDIDITDIEIGDIVVDEITIGEIEITIVDDVPTVIITDIDVFDDEIEDIHIDVIEITIDEEGFPEITIDDIEIDIEDYDLDPLDLTEDIDISVDLDDLEVDISDLETDLDIDPINPINIEKPNIENVTLPSEIRIMHVPDKVTYNSGEEIDIEGIVVQAYMEDGSVWEGFEGRYQDGYIPAHELKVSSSVLSGNRIMSKTGSILPIDYVSEPIEVVLTSPYYLDFNFTVEITVRYTPPEDGCIIFCNLGSVIYMTKDPSATRHTPAHLLDAKLKPIGTVSQKPTIDWGHLIVDGDASSYFGPEYITPNGKDVTDNPSETERPDEPIKYRSENFDRFVYDNLSPGTLCDTNWGLNCQFVIDGKGATFYKYGDTVLPKHIGVVDSQYSSIDDIGVLAYYALYGDLHDDDLARGKASEVTVSWARPKDGRILSATYDIVVIPEVTESETTTENESSSGPSQHSTSTHGDDNSGGSHSSGHF